jgi:CBS domain-containing protein
MDELPQPVVHLSSVLRSPLLDRAGERLGRVEDLIVRLADGGYPPVTGLKARIGGRELFVPADKIASLEPGAVRLSAEKLSLGRFERRPGEVLLAGDVLGRKLVYVEADPPRLVTAHEIELACIEGWWRIVGVDHSTRAQVRRALPRPLRGLVGDRPFLDWSDMEPFVGHVPTSRLKMAARRLVRLHPAQIADLVEAASHEEGEEILEAVGQDKELEADVFEELDDEHQVEFLRERSDAEAAGVLARMESDDAADLLMELDQERRLPILNLLPAPKQAKIRSLLSHNPETAGGLMNPDFILVPGDTSAADALARVRTSDLVPQQSSSICVVDDGGRLLGTLPLVDLIRADGAQPVSELIESSTPSVALEAEIPEVARLMSDYNMIAMPVLDGEGRPVGIVAVDDVLELLVPEEWRRRAGAARD